MICNWIGRRYRNSPTRPTGRASATGKGLASAPPIQIEIIDIYDDPAGLQQLPSEPSALLDLVLTLDTLSACLRSRLLRPPDLRAPRTR